MTEITRAALGQVGSLGELYDAGIGKFLGSSFLNMALLPGRVEVKFHSPELEMTWIVDHGLAARFSLLEIPMDQQASYVVGLLNNLKGSGKFLNDDKNNQRSVRSALKISVRTRTESFDLSTTLDYLCLSVEELMSKVSPSSATHFVSQIHWGSQLILIFEHKNEENEDVNEVMTKLQSFVQELIPCTDPFRKVTFKAIERSLKKHSIDLGDITVKIYSDCNDVNQLPRELSSIHAFMDLINLVKGFSVRVEQDKDAFSSNVGIGKPLFYSLVPLSSYVAKIDTSPMSMASFNIKNIYEDQFLPIFTSVVEVFKKNTGDQEILQQMTEAFKDTIRKFETDVKNALVAVRRGDREGGFLTDIISEFQNRSGNQESWVDSILFAIDKTFGAQIEKMKFVRQLLAKKVRVIQFDQIEEIVQRLSASTGNSVVVLFYKTPKIGNISESDNFELNRKFFLTCLQETYGGGKKNECSGYVDQSLQDSCNVLFKVNPKTPVDESFSISTYSLPNDILHDLQNIPVEDMFEMISLEEASEFYTVTVMGKVRRIAASVSIELMNEMHTLLKYENNFKEDKLKLNSAQNGSWGKEEEHDMQVKENEVFKMKIWRDSNEFKILVNDESEVIYNHQFQPISPSMRIVVSGDVDLFILTVDLQCKNNTSRIFQGFPFVDKKSQYILVDCDAVSEDRDKRSKCVSNTTIYIYEHGKIVSKNLLQSSISCLSKRIAKPMKPLQKYHAGLKPRKRSYGKIRCPGSFNVDPCPCPCKGSSDFWFCWKCHERLEFGFDGHFYCSCGKGEVTNFVFRCDGDGDGKSQAVKPFFKFENEDQLSSELAALEPFKEMNILLLGATGVGKSTWINGFANYLMYDSLEEATEKEIIAPVPCSFTLTNDNFEQVVISVGQDSNEVLVAGQSATQYPKSYTFANGNTLVRIIDTPGIGDPRGLARDKENFQNIMKHISYIDQINGICILLKPNESRLDIVFEFCIKELLTHIHRDAAKNVVFCFTNARGTFYRPGDSFASLQALLSSQPLMSSLIKLNKDTVYCMDNEAFRFLAAIKNGQSFQEEDKRNFSTSWAKAVINETERLMQHFRTLKPHGTKNTVSLNNIRQIILNLAKPIADITQNIQTNITLLKDKEDDLKSSNQRYSDLSEKLYAPQVNLDIIPLGYPKTVCGSPQCTESIELPLTNDNSKLYRTAYTQICHERCNIKGVATDQLNCAELQNCACMKLFGKYTRWASCKHCGCSWTMHLHITYNTQQKMVQVKNKYVESDIKTEESQNAQIQNVIEQCQERIKSYEEEQQIITKASAQFAVFLKNNAITPYNDAILRYLDYKIELEENKIRNNGHTATFHGLEKMKTAYLAEVQILETALKADFGNPSEGEGKGAVNISPEDIYLSLQHLFTLPLNGNTIEKLVESANDAARFFYFEKAFVPKSELVLRCYSNLNGEFGNTNSIIQKADRPMNKTGFKSRGYKTVTRLGRSIAGYFS